METIKQRDVSTAQDLIAAVRDRSVDRIVVSGDLAGLSSLELLPDQALTAAARATLQFKDDSDGIRLSSNNKLENLTLIAAPQKRAIFNDMTVTDLGCLELRTLTLTGAIQILAADRVRSGHVEAHNIDIVSADTRGYEARPKAYGVEVITGAFTIWNRQLDPSTTITADLTEISTGRPNSPVHGSGIFVSGAGETGGRLLVRRLETGVIHCDARIAHGTPDRISAGVFPSYGAIVDLVRTHGRVTTYGPNDMALDNWGVVDRWISEEKIAVAGGLSTHGSAVAPLDVEGSVESLFLKGGVTTIRWLGLCFQLTQSNLRGEHESYSNFSIRWPGSDGLQGYSRSFPWSGRSARSHRGNEHKSFRHNAAVRPSQGFCTN
jgi:hypothetical protein